MTQSLLRRYNLVYLPREAPVRSIQHYKCCRAPAPRTRVGPQLLKMPLLQTSFRPRFIFIKNKHKNPPPPTKQREESPSNALQQSCFVKINFSWHKGNVTVISLCSFTKANPAKGLTIQRANTRAEINIIQAQLERTIFLLEETHM